MEENNVIHFWECSACGHHWTNRKPQKPYNCPKCRKYLYIYEVNTAAQPCANKSEENK